MADAKAKSDPKAVHWLVAAWPGMGNVAVLAAGYLIQKLGLQYVGELPPRGRFDVEAVEVKDGTVVPPRMPRSLLYQAPGGGRKLTVFVGEMQPSTGAYAFAHELLERAAQLGVERVITFASMASQLHPEHEPRVFGAATDSAMVDELRRLEVRPLGEGEIGGLNGVLLGAAAERGLPGVCLMGEIPFFGAGVPNPKAAKAVLDAFSLMTGFEVDLEELTPHIKAIEGVLMKMLEHLQSQQEGGLPGGVGDEADEIAASAAPDKPEPRPAAPAPAPEPQLDYNTRQKIEKLFEEARKDRSKAMHLKQELDRLKVFTQYENRFLDLFRRAA